MHFKKCHEIFMYCIYSLKKGRSFEQIFLNMFLQKYFLADSDILIKYVFKDFKHLMFEEYYIERSSALNLHGKKQYE